MHRSGERGQSAGQGGQHVSRGGRGGGSPSSGYGRDGSRRGRGGAGSAGPSSMGHAFTPADQAQDEEDDGNMDAFNADTFGTGSVTNDFDLSRQTAQFHRQGASPGQAWMGSSGTGKGVLTAEELEMQLLGLAAAPLTASSTMAPPPGMRGPAPPGLGPKSAQQQGPPGIAPLSSLSALPFDDPAILTAAAPSSPSPPAVTERAAGPPTLVPTLSAQEAAVAVAAPAHAMHLYEVPERQDPHFGWMRDGDVTYVHRVQLSQLVTATPDLDDYYYLAYRRACSLRHNTVRPQGGGLHTASSVGGGGDMPLYLPMPPLPERWKILPPRATSKALQGALGRISYQNSRKPREALTLSDVNASADVDMPALGEAPSEAATTSSPKQPSPPPRKSSLPTELPSSGLPRLVILKKVEEAYETLVALEVLDREEEEARLGMSNAVYSADFMAQQRRDLQTTLFAQVGLPEEHEDGENINGYPMWLSLLEADKGKRLMARLQPLLSPAQQVRWMTGFVTHLGPFLARCPPARASEERLLRDILQPFVAFLDPSGAYLSPTLVLDWMTRLMRHVTHKKVLKQRPVQVLASILISRMEPLLSCEGESEAAQAHPHRVTSEQRQQWYALMWALIRVAGEPDVASPRQEYGGEGVCWSGLFACPLPPAFQPSLLQYMETAASLASLSLDPTTEDGDELEEDRFRPASHFNPLQDFLLKDYPVYDPGLGAVRPLEDEYLTWQFLALLAMHLQSVAGADTLQLPAEQTEAAAGALQQLMTDLRWRLLAAVHHPNPILLKFANVLLHAVALDAAQLKIQP